MNLAVNYVASFALEVLERVMDLTAVPAVLWIHKSQRAIAVGVPFDSDGNLKTKEARKLMSRLQWSKIEEICPSGATLKAKVILFKDCGGLQKVRIQRLC